MSYAESKVYFDGSHYIAIPHTTRPVKKRPKLPEETITVEDKETKIEEEFEPVISPEIEEEFETEEVVENAEIKRETSEIKAKTTRQITKKELFNELYRKYIDLRKKERKSMIIKDMQIYFDSYEKCEQFVSLNFERKLRNLICRRVRMVRKANLAEFNYFCTFTYDDKLHTEYSFKKKLKIALQHLSCRRKWKYMGVWERAPETQRLHFHGLFHIPDGTMPGEIEEHKDFNFKLQQLTTTYQSSYFNERFGRSDFKEINSRQDLMEEISYIMKYIEKTEEKIVYSKGLYQYFLSDIIEDDIVCTIGQEDRKLLLFDDFHCLDEGVLIGRVSPDVIEQMRKCN